MRVLNTRAMTAFPSISFAPSFYRNSEPLSPSQAEDIVLNEMRAIKAIARYEGTSKVRVYRTKGSFGPGTNPITLKFVDDGCVRYHATLGAVIKVGRR